MHQTRLPKQADPHLLSRDPKLTDSIYFDIHTHTPPLPSLPRLFLGLFLGLFLVSSSPRLRQLDRSVSFVFHRPLRAHRFFRFFFFFLHFGLFILCSPLVHLSCTTFDLFHFTSLSLFLLLLLLLSCKQSSRSLWIIFVSFDLFSLFSIHVALVVALFVRCHGRHGNLDHQSFRLQLNLKLNPFVFTLDSLSLTLFFALFGRD